MEAGHERRPCRVQGRLFWQERDGLQPDVLAFVQSCKEVVQNASVHQALALLAVLMGILAGCAADGGLSAGLSEEPAQVIGVVRSLSEPPRIGVQGQGLVSSGLLRFLVEADRKLPTGEPGLIWVTVVEESRVFVETNGKRRAANPSEIRPRPAVVSS